VRLYRLGTPPKAVALLEFTRDAIRMVRMLHEDAAGLEGAITASRLESLRNLLATGYVLTNHDPDDSFFRAAEIVSLDEILVKWESSFECRRPRCQGLMLPSRFLEGEWQGGRWCGNQMGRRRSCSRTGP
jgi:hypothetical protein